MRNLNYIYFVILTIMFIWLFFAKRVVIKNPLNREQRLALTGTEALWIAIFSTGILTLSIEGLLDLSSIRMLEVEILLLLTLMTSKNKSIFGIVSIFFIIFFLWEIIGLTYTTSISFGIRTILKFMYAFMMMITASAVVRNKEIMYKAALWARIVAIGSIIIAMFPNLNYNILPIYAYGTALAICYTFMMVLSLALYFYCGRRTIDLILAFIFIIPCFVWVFRTSIMGSTVALIVFFFFRYKVRSLPIIFGIGILAVISVFTIPSLREKMFKEQTDFTFEDFQKGKVEQEDINDNSRTFVWTRLTAHQYYGKEIIGSGTGSTQYYMYNAPYERFRGVKVAHNEYVMLVCDHGIIGVVLYCFIMLALLIHSFIIYQRKKHGTAIRVCAIVSGSAIAGLAATMYSDNTILYSMSTLGYTFGFYGMMLGLLKAEKET